jgi:hypothetical protein
MAASATSKLFIEDVNATSEGKYERDECGKELMCSLDLRW